MALVLTINGAALPAGAKLLYGSLDIGKSASQETATFKVYSPNRNTPYRPLVSDTVRLAKDGALLFGGQIIEVTDTRPLEPDVGGTVTTCSCRDWSFLAQDIIPVKHTIVAGTTVTAAFAHVFTNYLAGRGCTNVSGSGGPTIDVEMKWDHQPVKSILDSLTKATGWPWRINGDRVCVIAPPGSIPAPVTLNDSNGYIVGGLSWSRTRAELAHRIFLLTAGDKDWPKTNRTEYWSGDNVKTVFYLTVEPAGVPTAVKVNGVSQAVPGGGWTYDDAWHALVKSTPPPLGSNNIDCTFQVALPAWVRGFDYNSGFSPSGALRPDHVDQIRAPIELPKAANQAEEDVPKTEADTLNAITTAINFAAAEIQNATNTPKRVTVATDVPGFYPLQAVTLDFSNRGVTGSYLIQDVNIRDEIRNDNTAQSLRFTLTCVEGSRLVTDWRDYFREKFGGGSGGGGQGSSGGGTTPPGPGTGGGGTMAPMFAGGDNNRGVWSTTYQDIPNAVPLLIGGTGWPAQLRLQSYVMVSGASTSVRLRVWNATGGSVLAGPTSAVNPTGGMTELAHTFTTPATPTRILVQYMTVGTVGEAVIGMTQIEPV